MACRNIGASFIATPGVMALKVAVDKPMPLKVSLLSPVSVTRSLLMRNHHRHGAADYPPTQDAQGAGQHSTASLITGNSEAKSIRNKYPH